MQVTKHPADLLTKHPTDLPKAAPYKLVIFEKLEPEYGIGYTRSHIAALEAEGLFPKRVALSEGRKKPRIAWCHDELVAMIERLKAARRA